MLKFFALLFKVFLYCLLAGLAVAAFYYLEATVAFALVAFVASFLLMLSYLKNHFVDLEGSEEYKNASFSNLEDRPVLRIKSPNEREKIKVDPQAFQRFQKALAEKTREQSPEAFAPEKSFAEEGVTVSLNQRNSAGKGKTAPDKELVFAQHGRTAHEKQLGSSSNKPRDKVPAFKEEGSNYREKEEVSGSIFDELIAEKVPFLEGSKDSPFKPKAQKTKQESASQPLSVVWQDEPAVAEESDQVSHQGNHQGKLKKPAQLAAKKAPTPLEQEPPEKPILESLEGEENLASTEIVGLSAQLIENKKYPEAKQAIEKFLAEPKFALSPSKKGELLFQLGRAEIELGNPEAARSLFFECFSKHFPRESVNFQTKLETTVLLFKEKKALSLAIPFLITSLSVKRQVQDYPAMDGLYQDIAAAYLELQDDNRLIETYQNHLAIKNKLQDYEGELDILDKLGKLYFDHGDQQGSKFCYQKSLEVRQAMLEIEPKKKT